MRAHHGNHKKAEAKKVVDETKWEREDNHRSKHGLSCRTREGDQNPG